jgi:hypothetical protein
MIQFTEAQKARARRRKSRWNLLLVPAVLLPLVALWVAGVLVAQHAHTLLYPGQTLRNATGYWVVVATLAPVFAAVPLGMLAGNFLVWLVGPARRVLNREAASDPALTFGATQAALLRVARLGVALGVIVTTLGTFGPW